MIPSSFFVASAHQSPRHALHGLIWRGDAAGAPPLFCVHGLSRNAFDFSRLAEALCGSRTVISLDMAGRGFSDFRDPSGYTYPAYIADCLAALDALGINQVDWCGTSMGGLIGMLIAGTHPGRIRRLVLNDVGPYLPLSALKRIAAYVGGDPEFADAAAAEKYFRATYEAFGIREDRDWRRFTLTSLRRINNHYKLHYDARIADAFGLVQADIDLWPAYDLVRCPTLLLRGARSDILRREDAEKMTARGPRATLVEFRGCGHAPALIEAEQVEAVRSFLSD